MVDVVQGRVRDRPAGAGDEAVDIVEHEGGYVRCLVRPVVVEVGVTDVAQDICRAGVLLLVPDLDVVQVTPPACRMKKPYPGSVPNMDGSG